MAVASQPNAISTMSTGTTEPVAMPIRYLAVPAARATEPKLTV